MNSLWIRATLVLLTLLNALLAFGAAAHAATPGTPSASHDNWDKSDDYTITWNMWWGENGTSWELYEDDALIDSGTLTAVSPYAQSASTDITDQDVGTYAYYVVLSNADGDSTSTSIDVEVVAATEDGADDGSGDTGDDGSGDDGSGDGGTGSDDASAPGSVSVSHDNWDTDDDYTITWNMWWGENATSWHLYEDDSLVDEGTLTAATPAAQSATVDFTDKAVGTYSYHVVLKNTAGDTTSSAVDVTVASASTDDGSDDSGDGSDGGDGSDDGSDDGSGDGSDGTGDGTTEATGAPAKPTARHDNWDLDGTFSIYWDKWWGENGTSWRIYEDGIEIATGTLTPTVDNEHQAGDGVEVGGDTPLDYGSYVYTVGLINDEGETFSAPITVEVGSGATAVPDQLTPPEQPYLLPDVLIDDDADTLMLVVEYGETEEYTLSVDGASEATFTATTYDPEITVDVDGSSLEITGDYPGLGFIRILGGGGDRYIGVQVLEADGSEPELPDTPEIDDYTCGTCTTSDCLCASTHPPGGLAPEDTPQFILVTFDDGLTPTSYQAIQQVLDRKGEPHLNPDGTALRASFMVSLDYTVHSIVEAMYDADHEIAVHTMTHTTGRSTTKTEWETEILDAQDELAGVIDVPLSEMGGFRAPYLLHTDESFAVLHENGMLYDTSMIEFLSGMSETMDTRIWPYTFDFGSAQECYVGDCPDSNYPGLWEIPMWDLLEDDGTPYASMDPAGDHDELVALYKANFLPRYLGNRAPMGIFLHAGWLADDDHITGLTEFLNWAEGLDNVWFVTNTELIEWMKDPKSIDEMPSE